VREGLQSALRILRGNPHGPEVSVPPPDLPPARVLWVPDRGEMFLREQGGPAEALPVLLLHGWTASADTTWFSVYRSLAGRHPLVAIDQRGHGRGIRAEEPFSLEACADDAAALLELLGIRRVIVAGYSLGGAVALLLWQRHRELVAGAVLGGTAAEWRATPRQRLLWRSLGVFELALRVGTGDGFVQRYLHYAVGKSPEVADLRAWVGGEFKRGYPQDIAEAGRVLAHFDARRFVDAIDVPCCSLVTEHDRLVRPREQWALAEALGAPAVTVDGDHDAPLVHPARFGSAMAEAVEIVAGAAAAGHSEGDRAISSAAAAQPVESLPTSKRSS
jgi:3-oxoadipate enol-lactonase